MYKNNHDETNTIYGSVKRLFKYLVIKINKSEVK